MSTSRDETERTLSVVLYTRRGCHLCDEAHKLLTAHQLAPKLVDVDEDELMRERFGCQVPVVEINGRVRFRGHVNPVLLRRLVLRL